jgi:hypothetical protein
MNERDVVRKLQDKAENVFKIPLDLVSVEKKHYFRFYFISQLYWICRV